MAFAGGDLGLKTVVIDPGHGGNDPGAISADRKSQEKAFTLDISKRLASLIQESCPDVKVILTRSVDEYLTLAERAEKANKAGADLFISVHINSATNKSANGFSVHVLGQSSNKNRDLFAYNLDVCQRENAVILLEDDYSTKYEGFDPKDPESLIFMTLMQNSSLEQSMRFAQTVSSKLKGGPIKSDRGLWQDPFYVLWKTSMPAVLVELGFISNATDLEVLRQNDKRQSIAQRLFDAFREYKTYYDSTVSLGGQPQVEDIQKEQKTAPATAPAAKADASVKYGVQIFASVKSLPKNSKEFMGYEPLVITGPRFHKYIIAVSDNVENSRARLAEIRKKYPEAFLVRVEGENIQRISK